MGLVLGLVMLGTAGGGEHWPAWRGPSGNGTSDATGLPIHWNLATHENIVWKTELPSWSGSTPIIWGDYIFLMSPSKSEGASGNSEAAAGAQGTSNPPGNPTPKAGAEPAGKEPPGKKGFGEPGGPGRGGFGKGGFGGFGPPGGFGKGGYGRANRDPGGQALLLMCLSKKDGRVLWQRELDRGNRVYNKQNSSSPSPVTDGKLVWAVTGNGVVSALDFEGNLLWQKNLQQEYGRFGLNWGYGSSPLLFRDRLIIEVLHGMHTDDPSYLIALEGTTGKVLWRVERPTDAPRESPDAYTTPALLMHEGKPQIVVSGGDYVTAHDPDTGKELWRVPGLNPNRNGNYRIVGSPVVVGDMIYAPTRNRPLLALRMGPGATAPSLVWKWDDDGGPDVPTPTSDGTYFYMVADNGLMTCIEVATGKKVYQKRLSVGATIDASPLLADGKLYITGENAVTVVLKAGPEFEELARNELDGTFTMSSLAVSGDKLFLRTSTHLYCLGRSASTP
jgi:outer membrane protein assembly factor BamB